MNEQWQELKETIIEMRDNNGTGTQQEVCKFLVDLMNILEKQMQEPSGDLISRHAVLDAIEDDNRNGMWSCFVSDDDAQKFKTVIKELPSVKQEPKTGHWNNVSICGYRCSECGKIQYADDVNELNYCCTCGAKNGK
jgi:hypothetical protein